MAQRILLVFDALDKYSQEILAKQAKKRSLSYLQKIPSLIIPLSLDFESDVDPDPNGKITDRTTPSSRSPITTQKVNLRPFTSSGHCCTQDYEKKKRELKKLARPRCFSADRRRSWRSEVQSIPDLDTLCHMGHTGPVLSSLGAPFTGSPRDIMQDSGTAVEVPELPSCGVDTKIPARGSSLPDTLGCSRTDDKPCRESPRRAAAVSLCIEDEMQKSDAKIITVRQKMVKAPVQNVSETHPIIYNSPISSLSDFQRNLITRSNFFSSSQGPMGSSPLPHTRMTFTDFLRNRKLDVMKKKTNSTVILHYLSADGTKQRVEMANDGNGATKKQVTSPANRKILLQDIKPTHISPTNGRNMDVDHGVGVVINGMNPMIVMDQGSPTRGRTHQGSRLFYPSSTRTSSPQIPRPHSVREVHSLSYVSISKPLSPPESPSQPLQKKDFGPPASPDLVKDTVMPTYGMRPVMYTAKSVTLENRYRKSRSSTGENPIGRILESERSPEGSQEERKEEGDGTTESVRERDETQAPPATEGETKDESKEEQVQKYFSIPLYLSATPIINIPTATIDSGE